MIRYTGTVNKRSLYERWYAKFPVLIRSRDVNLKELPPPKPNASWYEFGTETIILVRGYGDDVQSYTHELAHHLHLKILTPTQQAAWATFYNANRLSMPSEYARKGGPNEGFPEALTYWLRGLPVKRCVKDFLTEMGLAIPK